MPTSYLIREVFRVWWGKAYPHIWIDIGHSVQKVCKAKASLFCAIHTLEASAKLSVALKTGELQFRQVSIAVHILPKKGDLLYSLQTNTLSYEQTPEKELWDYTFIILL